MTHRPHTEEFTVVEEEADIRQTADFQTGAAIGRAINPTFARGFLGDTFADPSKMTEGVDTNSRVRSLLLQLKIDCSSNNHEQAIGKLKQIEDILRGNLTERMLRIKAKLLMKLGKPIPALMILQQLSASTEQQLFTLALVQFEAGNSQRAKKVIEELLLSTRKHDYYVLLGDIYLSKADVISAQEQYEKAKSYQDSSVVMGRLANLIITRQATENYNQAVGMLSRAIATEPNNYVLYSNRAYILQRSRQSARAQEEYMNAFSIRKHPTLENNIAVLEYWRNSTRSAKEMLQRLAFATKDVRIVLNFIQIVRKVDDAKTAFDYIVKLREKWSTFPQFMRAEADILYEMDNKPQTGKLMLRLRGYCQQHREDKPANQLFCKLAAICAEENLLIEAQTALRWFLNNDVDQLMTLTRANLNNTMGFLKIRLGKPAEALEYLKKANDAQVMDCYPYNYAFFLHLNRQNDVALKIINQAIAKNPSLRYDLLKLKILCSDRHRWRDADSFAEKMLKYYPERKDLTSFLKAVRSRLT